MINGIKVLTQHTSAVILCFHNAIKLLLAICLLNIQRSWPTPLLVTKNTLTTQNRNTHTRTHSHTEQTNLTGECIISQALAYEILTPTVLFTHVGAAAGIHAQTNNTGGITILSPGS